MADWRTDLCRALGHTANARNLQALDLWARSEALPSHFHNPLGAGVLDYKTGEWLYGREVPVYASIGDAVREYRRLLTSRWFDVIGISLGVPGDLAPVWEAVNGSRWRPRGYQSGFYPVLLWRVLSGPVLGIPPPDQPVSALAHDLYHAWHNLTTELHHHTVRQITRARHFSGRLHSAVR